MNYKIMIVEDDPDIAELVSRHLGKFGFTIEKCIEFPNVLKEFEKACGKKISYKSVERREGDITKCFADASKAYEVLGWKAEKGIDEMCEDSWRWQSQNPNGYEEKE